MNEKTLRALIAADISTGSNRNTVTLLYYETAARMELESMDRLRHLASVNL